MTISFDHLPATFDDTRALPPEVLNRLAGIALHLVNARPETTFVEPGVGTGRIALPFVQRGCAYTGVDVSAPMLAAFGQKVESTPHRLSLVRADATALPFKDASFDVAITAHVLYLIPDWQQALAELRRVLKPGGSYLYCYEKSVNNPALEAFNRQWQAILDQIGHTQDNSILPDDEPLRLLQAQGATLEATTVAEWRSARTVAGSLATYAARMCPLYPDIPEATFDAAVHSFSTWAHNHYPTANAVLACHTTLELVLVRNWTASPGSRGWRGVDPAGMG